MTARRPIPMVPAVQGRSHRGWNGVRSARLWKRLLGVEHTVIEQVRFDEDAQAVVARVRPTRSRRRRCPRCARRCPGYDQGEGRRRWRALDLGVMQAFLEADAPRVCCPEHGVIVAAMPWARPGAWFTRGFEDTCAWLAVHTSRSAVGSRPARSAAARVVHRTGGRRSGNCCGWRGARSGGSARGSLPSRPRMWTGSLGCAGSA